MGAQSTPGVINLSCKREYFGTIKQVVMNDVWTAVLSEGKVSLHLIEDESAPDLRIQVLDDVLFLGARKVANQRIVQLW